jgi:leader peptidase (prepilin peptidase)/N-methyltransferase
MTALVAAISGVYGLVIGSFLNVVIWRVPRQESIVKPPSHCPACDVKIANRDNIPVVSWLLLRGKCRNCGTAISPRYVFVELLTGVLFAAVGARFAHSLWPLPTYLVLTAALIALSAIDLEHYLLPNRILYPTDVAVVGLLAVASAAESDWGAFLRAAAAGALAFAIFFLIHVVSPRGMGFGDVRLAFLLGFSLGWLGWGEVAGGLFAGFVYGAVVGVALIAVKVRGRKQQIPFGPFLAAGAMTFVLFGEPIVDWYRHLGR